MPENYRTLTRTYRPRTFDEIVSQDHVSETLQNAIKQERLAHAYMFCGPRGVGKTTMARVLARRVNSIEKEVSGESLNQTLNVIEIDAASNNGVDDIRDLRERVRIPPQNGRYKIYIIDEVHMLSKAAFNALLKTLEEPPDHVIFIFATTEPHKVLPTILSRVQRFDFKRISVDEIVARLQDVAENEGINVDNESLHVIAKKADGALRDALGLLDQAIAFCGTDIQHEELLRALNVVSTDRLFQFMEAVENHDSTGGLQLIDELLQEGYDIQEFLVELTEHLRNLYVAQNSENMHLVEASENVKKRYREAADIFTEDDLMRMLHIVSEAQFKVKEAHQPKIQFEITLLKLIHMERSRKLNALIGELQQLKKNGRIQRAVDKSASNGKKSASPDPSFSKKKETKTKEEKPPKNSKKAESREEKKSENPPPAEKSEVPDSNSSPADQPTDDSPGNIFGSPSLGNPSPAETMAASTKQKKETEEKSNDSKPQKITLDTVKEKWDSYVTSLKKQVPEMIYFQMQRVEPVKLNNRELLLRCNDHFAKKMVEEHRRELAKKLKVKIGGFLQMKCKVKEKDEDNESSMSPYERFKKLQERDPKIKTLVELFGAELDYNLNQ
ncbi:MAG TPA: DNA polymerase III subunit gamma/tau [Balneolaceae bacterium]|nr:DNA polymerase III subunit gamma/tau [Balneolaceae bacterium]